MQSKYVSVRDFVITEIALNNARRSGAIANMTMAEYTGARIEPNQHSNQHKKVTKSHHLCLVEKNRQLLSSSLSRTREAAAVENRSSRSDVPP